MKIQCNCCEERPIFDLPAPEKNSVIVFCHCSKILAAPKEINGVWSWQIFDSYFEKENFIPVKIIDENHNPIKPFKLELKEDFWKTVHPNTGLINLIFDK